MNFHIPCHNLLQSLLLQTALSNPHQSPDYHNGPRHGGWYKYLVEQPTCFNDTSYPHIYVRHMVSYVIHALSFVIGPPICKIYPWILCLMIVIVNTCAFARRERLSNRHLQSARSETALSCWYSQCLMPRVSLVQPTKSTTLPHPPFL